MFNEDFEEPPEVKLMKFDQIGYLLRQNSHSRQIVGEIKPLYTFQSVFKDRLFLHRDHEIFKFDNPSAPTISRLL